MTGDTVTGDCFAGTVVQRGPQPAEEQAHATQDVWVGEKVFGFAWRAPVERCHQTFITVPTYLLGRLPPNLTAREAVTVPTNLVTALHALTADLGLQLPWPLAAGWKPPLPHGGAQPPPILVWGAASSAGLYVVQVLRHWRYRNVLAVASAKHHAHLLSIGASACFDYHDGDVVGRVLAHASASGNAGAVPRVPLVLDCIGSAAGSLKPLTAIADPGSTVAVLLPVIIKDATRDEAPEYGLDAASAAPWKDGVDVRGVRTHFYLDVSLHPSHYLNTAPSANRAWPSQERLLQVPPAA